MTTCSGRGAIGRLPALGRQQSSRESQVRTAEKANFAARVETRQSQGKRGGLRLGEEDDYEGREEGKGKKKIPAKETKRIEGPRRVADEESNLGLADERSEFSGRTSQSVDGDHGSGI